MIFDTDLGFRIGNVAHNSLARVASPAAGSAEHTSSRLFRGLLKSPEYRRLLIDHLADLMNGPFAAQRVAAKINEYDALLAHSRAEHFQRWQSSGTMKSGGRVTRTCGPAAAGLCAPACGEPVCEFHGEPLR